MNLYNPQVDETLYDYSTRVQPKAAFRRKERDHTTESRPSAREHNMTSHDQIVELNNIEKYGMMMVQRQGSKSTLSPKPKKNGRATETNFRPRNDREAMYIASLESGSKESSKERKHALREKPYEKDTTMQMINSLSNLGANLMHKPTFGSTVYLQGVARQKSKTGNCAAPRGS